MVEEIKNWIANRFNAIIATTPTTTQHNLNTVVGLDMKMTVQTPPPTETQQWAPGATD